MFATSAAYGVYMSVSSNLRYCLLQDYHVLVNIFPVCGRVRVHVHVPMLVA